MDAADLVRDLEGCREAHQRLFASLSALTDPDIGRPTRLDGWTIGHVLTHLARNAEAMCRRIDGAKRNVPVEQYRGGPAGRDAEIESGAGRTAEEIRADVLGWSGRLDERFQSVATDVWERPVRTVSGGEHPLRLLPFRRWREVEVHLVDLALGASADEWSAEFVERVLPRLVSGLADRTNQRELALWLLGRGSAPILDPWG